MKKLHITTLRNLKNKNYCNPETKKSDKLDIGSESVKVDAVKMMREARDKISLETQDMSFEQLKAYIEQELKKGVKTFRRTFELKVKSSKL